MGSKNINFRICQSCPLFRSGCQKVKLWRSWGVIKALRANISDIQFCVSSWTILISVRLGHIHLKEGGDFILEISINDKQIKTFAKHSFLFFFFNAFLNHSIQYILSMFHFSSNQEINSLKASVQYLGRRSRKGQKEAVTQGSERQSMLWAITNQTKHTTPPTNTLEFQCQNNQTHKWTNTNRRL